MKALGYMFVLLGMVASSQLRANLLTNPDFETPESVGGILTTTGDWGWDHGSIVGLENGVSPQSGSLMLRFDSTQPNGGAAGDGSEILQLLDMTPYSTQIANGTAYLTGSAYFNRVAGDADTDTLFGLRFVAYSGSPADQPTTSTELGSSSSNDLGDFISDPDPGTWERVSHSWQVPTGTTYVKFIVEALENVTNDGVSPEFDGHYADNVVADVVPEPGVFALLIVGLAILRRFRR